MHILAGVRWWAACLFVFYFPFVQCYNLLCGDRQRRLCTDRLQNSRVEGIRESEYARDVMVSSILRYCGEKRVSVIFFPATLKQQHHHPQVARAHHPFHYADLVVEQRVARVNCVTKFCEIADAPESFKSAVWKHFVFPVSRRKG